MSQKGLLTRSCLRSVLSRQSSLRSTSSSMVRLWLSDAGRRRSAAPPLLTRGRRAGRDVCRVGTSPLTERTRWALLAARTKTGRGPLANATLWVWVMRVCGGGTRSEGVLRVILVMPVSSCEAERSFSALRRLKTWLRSTMGETRLSCMALAHVHQDVVDRMELVQLMGSFVTACKNRALASATTAFLFKHCLLLFPIKNITSNWWALLRKVSRPELLPTRTSGEPCCEALSLLTSRTVTNSSST
ncbi:unnamed protein product, partial [Ixodes hexagonus]